MSGFRPRFFITQAGTSACGMEFVLDAEDSHHAARVLRLQQGDECEVVIMAGSGGAAAGGVVVHAATVCDAGSPVRVRLTARLEGAAAGASYQREVGLVQALGRPAAMEYVLEKGTEVGASFFCFLRADGSPRGSDPAHADRLARWRRIVREAAKQSKQTAVPSVEVVDSLEQAVRTSSGPGGLALVLEPDAAASLHEVVARRDRDECEVGRITLWTGPESGWTGHEMERFSMSGIAPVRLGRSVLRTETAGPVAVAVTRLALGDW